MMMHEGTNEIIIQTQTDDPIEACIFTLRGVKEVAQIEKRQNSLICKTPTLGSTSVKIDMDVAV